MERVHESRAVISLLTQVTRRVIDSTIAFDVAANDARAFSYYVVLEHRAGERKLIATRLQQLIRSLGQRPPLLGTLAGVVRRVIGQILHRLFTNEAIIVELFNRAERKTMAKFEQLLNHPHISAETRAAVEQEFRCMHDGYLEFQKLAAELRQRRGRGW